MSLRNLRLAGAALAVLAMGAACSQEDAKTAQAPAPAKSAGKVAPAPPVQAGSPEQQAKVDQINKALYAETAAAAPDQAAAVNANTTATAAAEAPDPMLVKAQVLLARANFSSGVIDGLPGTNLKDAIAAFATATGLQGGGDLNEAVWAKLNAPGEQPVAAAYTITAQDAAGPYYPDVGEDLWKLSKLDRSGFTTPLEMLGERFHMDQALLLALNPGADFAKAGTVIVVAQVGDTSLAPVDHVQVDKAAAGVRAYDKADTLIAFLPATVGSTERPSPSGVHKVKGVAKDPTYTYDPKKLTWGPRKHGKFTVPAGPNNPVGAVWIDLDAPSYGLHGTPDPKEIGKTASHGCVRMTNWDAKLLASAVKPGVEVTFVNARGAKA